MTDLRVSIRMYKRILGDCFLIRLEQGEDKAHILIDCGVLQGTDGAAGIMQEIAEDIRVTCGSRLDLLVVTHEHWDHISGFALARDWFFDQEDGTKAKIAIDNVWFAWTENPEDDQAKALRKRFARSNRIVAALAGRLDSAAVANPAFGVAAGLAMDNLQNFIGVEDGSPLALKGRLTGKRIMAELSEAAKARAYLEPGSERKTPEPIPLRTFVLGPPRDEEKLFKALAHADDEHQHFSAPTFNDGLLLAVSKVVDGDDEAAVPLALTNDQVATAQARESPFSKRYRGIGEASVRNSENVGDAGDPDWAIRNWFKTRYFSERPLCRFGTKPPEGHDRDACEKDLECGADQAVKRIDDNWLAAAGGLALKLDNDTNNTSLVLAFELPNKTVMLFAADAQVGNWESWGDHDYDGQKLDALLGRVCFYKVGHHGSHNATRVAAGLEKMNTAVSAERPLVAMIPTDEQFALEQGAAGKGWKMPAQHVREALLRKTGGRTLYGDREHGDLPKVGDKPVEPDKSIRIFPADKDFKDRLTQKKLFVEYCVFDGAKDRTLTEEQP